MKKPIIYLVKLINRLTNNQTTPREDAETILRLFLLKEDTQRSLNIFECLEDMFESELIKRRTEANKISKLVNHKFPTNSKVSVLTVNDPIFEQPIKQ